MEKKLKINVCIYIIEKKIKDIKLLNLTMKSGKADVYLDIMPKLLSFFNRYVDTNK
jgi:hypothetical protein